MIRGLKIESVRAERRAQEESREQRPESGRGVGDSVSSLPGSHGWCMAVLSWWVALSG